MAGWWVSLRWVSLCEDWLTRRHPQPFNQPMPATNRPSREPIITRPATTAPCHSAAISCIANRACPDIHNPAHQYESAPFCRQDLSLRMPRHTQRDVSTCADTKRWQVL